MLVNGVMLFVQTYCGQSISWVTEIRYLGIYFASSRSLKCTLDMAKRSFYRTADAILGKVGGRAPEDVILELVRSKCLPALLYGLEACPLRKSDISSLDFVVNRFFMKLFQTNNIDIGLVNYYRAQFEFDLSSTVVEKRSKKLVAKYRSCENVICIFA